MVDKLDVSHSGTAGNQALLAGILRGDGNVKANLDSQALPWATPAPAIIAGVTGVITFKIAGGTTEYAVPCLVTKLRFQSEVAGLVTYDFDVSLNILAGSGSASFSRPANGAS